MAYVRTEPPTSKVDHLATLIGQVGTEVWHCQEHGDFEISPVGRVTLVAPSTSL